MTRHVCPACGSSLRVNFATRLDILTSSGTVRELMAKHGVDRRTIQRIRALAKNENIRLAKRKGTANV